MEHDPGHDKGIEVPSWVAMAAKQRATVYVNGMREPVTIIEAMRLPERKMWAAAVHKEGSKEVSKLVASGVWLWELEEVPRISYIKHIPASRRVIKSHFVFKIKTKDDGGGRMVLDKCKARLTSYMYSTSTR